MPGDSDSSHLLPIKKTWVKEFGRQYARTHAPNLGVNRDLRLVYKSFNGLLQDRIPDGTFWGTPPKPFGDPDDGDPTQEEERYLQIYHAAKIALIMSPYYVGKDPHNRHILSSLERKKPLDIVVVSSSPVPSDEGPIETYPKRLIDDFLPQLRETYEGYTIGDEVQEGSVRIPDDSKSPPSPVPPTITVRFNRTLQSDPRAAQDYEKAKSVVRDIGDLSNGSYSYNNGVYTVRTTNRRDAKRVWDLIGKWDSSYLKIDGKSATSADLRRSADGSGHWKLRAAVLVGGLLVILLTLLIVIA